MARRWLLSRPKMLKKARILAKYRHRLRNKCRMKVKSSQHEAQSLLSMT